MNKEQELEEQIKKLQKELEYEKTKTTYWKRNPW